MTPKIKKVLIVLGILAIAAFLRFYALDKFPPGLYPDEAVNATDALRALEKGDLEVYYPNNNGREGLFMNLLALSFKFFGVGINTLRMVPALIGLLTILGVYLLGTEIIGYRGGLIASFLTAVSYWHLNFSRIGFRAILVPLILVFTFYLLFKSYHLLKQNKKKFDKKASWVYPALAGIIFGIGFHTYLAFRIAPAIIFVFFLLIWLVNLKNRLEIKRLVIFPLIFFALGSLLTITPIAYHFLENPEHLGSRQEDNSISVLDPKNNQGKLVLAVSKTFLQTLGQFFYKGDANWRHNLPSNPQLFPPVALSFLIGLLFITLKTVSGLINLGKSFFQKKRKKIKENKIVEYGTLLAWFFAMLAPAFLTVEGLPHALRSIGSLPAAYLIGTIPLVLLLKKNYFLSKKKKKVGFYSANFAKILVASVLLLALIYNSINYFVIWGESLEAAQAFEKRLVNIGKYIASSEKDNQYLIVNQEAKIIETGFPVSLETITFFSYGKNEKIICLLPTELNEIKILENTEIILQKTDSRLIKELEEKFPAQAITIPDEKFPEINFLNLRVLR
jgi:4-amino-4-deoxy-L-arabinose transferase-like glycosyltransferase